MHAGTVERIVAVDHPQKARALLEGLGPRRGTSFSAARLRSDPLASRKATILAASNSPMPETRASTARGRVDIDADRVDAILHHGVKRAGQFGFGDIVLILTDADGFGVDLHEFRERILQAPSDRGGAA